MAVEAGGLPYNSQNPSGIGAVYLSGDTDLNENLRNNLKMVDDAVVRRRALQEAQKAEAAKLLVSVNPKLDGIYPKDQPVISQALTDLETLRKEALAAGSDPSDPRWIDAYSKVKGAEKQIELMVQQSKGDNELLNTWYKEYDPAKHDQQTLDNWKIFGDADIMSRAKMDRSKGLIPHRENLQQIILKGLKAEQLKPKNVLNEKGELFEVKTTPQGKDVMIQQTETIPLNSAADLALGFNSNPEFNRAADAEWSKVQGTPNEDYYVDLAIDYQNKGLPVNNAFDAFKVQQIYLNNQKDAILSGLGQNMYAADALEGKKEDDSARGLYKDVVRMFAGDPSLLSPSYYESKRTKDAEGKANKIYGTKVKGLEGRTLGLYEYTKADGTKDTTPNIITKAFRNPNGTVYVITAQSQAQYDAGIIPDPAIPYKTPRALLTALISGTKSEGGDLTKADKLLGNLDKVEQEYREKYGNNWAAIAGLTPEQQRERDRISATKWTPNIEQEQTVAPATTAPTGKKTTKAKIKSLVGTKGYEGYDEKELTEYYKSQGYTIE